ncbi:MAG: hypothetical protein J2P37_36360, partial [Ktedonobacteraceae bacterium]|nr:hypothetical protein [Ktedonobacteraceae bacterium]
GGPDKRTQLHFAHQKSECAWSTEAESVRHMRGKTVLAQWLRTQFPQASVTLEERLPGPNRIADIFVVQANGERWAIEFQCAPLEIEEWHKRHKAYREAGIRDIWIIGCNRREKQETFIEAILTSVREIMFLDPQVVPPRIWLRWPISRAVAQEWQNRPPARPRATYAPMLDGWVGRNGYGATIIGSLSEMRLSEQVRLIHPMRTALEERTRLLQAMSSAEQPDEEQFRAYLRQHVDEEALQVVLLPLLRAYRSDPELLRRYNYGRGQLDAPPSEDDRQRVQKARAWLERIAQRGFSAERLRELVREIPFVGPYASFASYMEILVALAHAPR